MDTSQGRARRRSLLKAAGAGALLTTLTGTAVIGWGRSTRPAAAATTTIGLAATDGYVTVPAGRTIRCTSSGSSRSTRTPRSAT